jgi:hypothetical protein
MTLPIFVKEAVEKQGAPILVERNFSIRSHRGISNFDLFHEEKTMANSAGQFTFCGTSR